MACFGWKKISIYIYKFKSISENGFIRQKKIICLGGFILGSAININVKNDNEFNQQMQMYLAQGYNMKSNFNGTAILSKKSYSVGLLIILIILFFPLAIIYYLVASDDVVTINNTRGQSSATSSSDNKNDFVAYCTNCGQGLFKDSKFCPGCGTTINEDEMKKTPQLEYNKVWDK